MSVYLSELLVEDRKEGRTDNWGYADAESRMRLWHGAWYVPQAAQDTLREAIAAERACAEKRLGAAVEEARQDGEAMKREAKASEETWGRERW